MKPDRWKQIDEIFQAALERPPEERASFLDRACRGDEALRREVESLVEADSEAGSLLEAPAAGVAAGLLASASCAAPPARIGPYRLVRELGHGGMGTVYLAVRDDDAYRKRVAIKVIRRGMDTDEVTGRFRHERQILAGLDHPNIARLLHGDTTPDGLPYFVMEYVEGRPIDEYCDAKSLPVVERLRLFREVCAAVQYAHQNLVVHRDLKPSNILVTDDGAPKLLDFGIAKLLNPELYGQTVAPTGLAVRPMTPDYASPEQVRGLKVTTATDVYSLGVLLYELLTGHRPYRVTSTEPREIERVICEEYPERPSTAVGRTATARAPDGTQRPVTPESVSRTREGEPERLRRRLAGDLDNIVLMAMRKEPERRYQSAAQLSDDIRRHLEGLPVAARRDTLAYRASKFARRHRLGVAAALLLVGLLAAFAVSTRVQGERTRRERDKAERVAAFLVDLFNVSDPSESRGNTVTAREILDKGAERVERELSGQPEVQATLLNTIGKVYYKLGLYDRSIPLLEKAVSLRRATLGDRHLDVAQSLYDLAWALIEKEREREAEPLLREALAIRRELAGEESPLVADTLNLLGSSFYNRDRDASEAFYREGLALRRRLFPGPHKDLAQSLNNVALMLHDRGRYDEAEPMLREAIEIDRRLGGPTPEMSVHLNNYAMLKNNRGELDAAEALYREALAMKRAQLGDEHTYVADGLNNLAELLRERGEYAEAEPMYREAIGIARRQLGEENPRTTIYTNNLGRLLHERGDLAQAEPLLRRVAAAGQKLFGDSHRRTAKFRANLGALLADRGEASEAEPLLRQALAAQRAVYPEGHRDTAQTLVALGHLLTRRGRAAEAEPLLREALELRRRLLTAGHWNVAEAESALGGCLAALRRFEEAEPLLTGSYAALKAARPDSDPYRRAAAARLADLYQTQRRPELAAQYRAELALSRPTR